MNEDKEPIPCPTCSRPILLEELRCRSCGTRLVVYSADAEELDFSGDGDEWDDESTPDRGLVIFARVVTVILAAGSIGLFGWMSTTARGLGDWIGLVVVGLVMGFWLKRALMIAYLGA